MSQPEISQPEMTEASALSDRLSRELPELLELRRHLHAHPELCLLYTSDAADE